MDRKVVWVTGAAGEIGSALAWQLAESGILVAATDLAGAKLDDLCNSHRSIRAFPCDVTDLYSLCQTVQTIESKFGEIEIAILAAGIRERASVEGFDASIHHRTMAVNYGGVVNSIQAALPHMLRRGRGRLAILGSLAGYVGQSRTALSGYGPSKAALINLAEGLRKKLARRGIGVTIVNAGIISTTMAKSFYPNSPFAISINDAARRILAGIEEGRFEVAFPRSLVWGLRISRLSNLDTFGKILKIAGSRNRS